MKKFLGIVFISITCLLTANQPQAAYDQQISATHTHQDGDIVKKVQDILSSGLFSKGYHSVVFEVNQGVVTLTGSVDSLEDKNKIEEKVKGVEGVKQVNSHITVKANGKSN